MIGEVIGSYRIVSELGKGGMGMVYRAEHIQLGRQAAIKMLLPQLSSDAAIVQRFFNEARAASAIDHPGIVEIYDFGTHSDGRAYLVMALLRGESLEQRLRRGPLPADVGATIVAQAVAALAAAHARGIVHRDLKPDNMFLVPNDLMPGGIQVKLLDFGIAKLADDQTTGLKTQTGALMGTPAYMSPEQCMGRADLDHRTDIYAVGCILFHVFCGRPPFVSTQGTGMMIAAHIRDAAPDPRAFAPHLPPALAQIVLRCLEKEPDARFQTANDLRNALVEAGAHAPMSRPPPSEQYSATIAAPGPPSGSPYSSGSSPGSPDTGRPISGHPITGQPVTGPQFGHSPTGQPYAGHPVTGQPYAGHPATGQPYAGQPYAGHPATGPQFGHSPTGQPVHPAIGMGATTRGGAAAQVMGTMPAPGRSRTPLVIAGVLLVAAAAGAGTFVMRRADDRTNVAAGSDRAGSAGDRAGSAATGSSERAGSAAVATGDRTGSAGAAGSGERAGSAGTTASGEHTGSATEHALSNGSAAAGSGSALEITKPAEDPCPPGQTRRDDTRGHCCWPAQAWSSSGRKCVGAPKCPEGMVARRDQCIASEIVSPNHRTTPALAQSNAPSFHLDAANYNPGDAIDIVFTSPVSSKPQSRSWITVVEADRPPSAYGAWGYLDDGATSASLKAPTKPGAYQVRLHTDYPARTTNVVGAVSLTVGAPRAEADPGSEPTPLSGQRFTLAAQRVRVGARIDIRFPAALRAKPSEQFWITIVEATAGDNQWGTYEYVPAAARRMHLDAPSKPGSYEVRLHANYPTKTTNLVHRAAIQVDE